VGRHGGGNKVDAVQSESFAYLFGAAQMSPVYGIEGAAEQTDFHEAANNSKNEG
jgi:hypothetical protein